MQSAHRALTVYTPYTPFTPLQRVTSEVTVRVLAEVRVLTELRAYERRSGLETVALFADASSALIELP